MHLGSTESRHLAPPPGLHRDAGLATQPEDARRPPLPIEQGDREPERIGAEYHLPYALGGDQLQPLGLSIGSVVVNTWYDIDVTGQIGGDGTFSFALESASTNGADYRARESGSAWTPRLVIVVQ